MRPVDKKLKFSNDDGIEKIYTDYKQAKWDLIEALGNYCSYCEMNIQNQPDIEHVIPIAKEGDRLEWNNLLLSCKRCNILKSDRNDSREIIPFPDMYNTAYLYKYKNGKIQLNSELSDDDREKAQKLYDLVGLGRERDSRNRPDDRFIARQGEFEKAKEALIDYLKYLESSPNEDVVKLFIKRIASSVTGFFSVWIEVFKEYPEVKKLIFENSKGTACECYDSNYNPIHDIKRKSMLMKEIEK